MIARGITKFYENTKDIATDATGSLLYRVVLVTQFVLSPIDQCGKGALRDEIKQRLATGGD